MCGDTVSVMKVLEPFAKANKRIILIYTEDQHVILDIFPLVRRGLMRLSSKIDGWHTASVWVM